MYFLFLWKVMLISMKYMYNCTFNKKHVRLFHKKGGRKKCLNSHFNNLLNSFNRFNVKKIKKRLNHVVNRVKKVNSCMHCLM